MRVPDNAESLQDELLVHLKGKYKTIYKNKKFYAS